MKKKLAAVKNHFDRHRFAYGSITTSIVLGYFVTQRAEQWNEFLIEHDLFDEFYEMNEI